MITMRSRLLQLILVFISLSLLYLTTAFGLISSEIGDASNIKCLESEKQALLMIKQGLVDEDGYLSSWGNEQDKKDCCKWRGVTCSKRTDHVINLNLSTISYFGTPLRGNISSSLLELQHLNSLDTRHNFFDGPQIPEFIGSLTKLRYLDLSNSGFMGRVPYQLGNLSSLQYLDLSYNFGMYAEKLEWLSHLSSLKYIRLNEVNLTESIDWLQVVSELPSLIELQLGVCNLPSVNPSSISFLNSSKSIALLDLSDNDLSSSVYHWLSNFSTSLVDLRLSSNNLQGPVQDYAFWNMTSLMHLDLSSSKLQGPIPDYAFSKMTSLLHLDLSHNQIFGIPKSFRNLCSLKTLSFDNSNLTGLLPELFLNLSGCTRDTLEVLSLNGNMLSGSLPDFTLFSSLKELYLRENKLNGTFPKSFKQLSDLTTLDLANNQLWGSLPDLSLISSLEHLDISNNRLNEVSAKSIGQLSMLEDLDMSSNSLASIITEDHLSNLSRLTILDLSFNSLTMNFSSGWVPPFQLISIKLRDCKLGPHFPNWLKTQNDALITLDISNAGISDTVPDWLWDLSPMLNNVNLSNNHLSGTLPDLSCKFAGYPGIDLSSNLFEGPIPPVPPNVTSLILSKNKFTGSISFLCSIIGEYFSYLDLSYNQLSGEVPDCSKNWQKLTILNLASNNFSGKIPNSMDSDCTIMSLHLRNNSLIGELPSSMKSCTGLTVIELGNNKFSGTIPSWIGDGLFNLIVLSLRSNLFNGSLPIQLCNLAQVQVLDFSHNNISGTIPKCLNNLTSMAQKESSNAIITYITPFSLTSDMGGDEANFQDHALLVWKGIDSEYKKTLGLVKSIDLSSNVLSGEIPEEITSLVGLISLNVSSNTLTGAIPPRIGQINLLNTLDLSHNLLTGEIPESFSKLNSLGVLDLSDNNLSGKIPSGTKLQTFAASAFMGNPELCGSPLPNKCPEEESAYQDPATAVRENGDGIISLGFYISIVIGFISGFWGVCGTLLLKKSWRRAYFRYLNNVKDKIYVSIALTMAKLRRQHGN